MNKAHNNNEGKHLIWKSGLLREIIPQQQPSFKT